MTNKIIINSPETSLHVDKSLLKVHGKEITFEAPWIEYLTNCGAGQRSIDLISKLKTSKAVISGQQVSFLGGSTLLIYKIFSLINYSSFLEEELKIPCVPIFWLQTEDQDLQEISKIDLSNDLINYQTHSLRYNKNNRISVADLQLKELLPDKQDLFSNFSNKKLIQALDIYYNSNSLGEAFSSLFYFLFPNLNVLFFDSRKMSISNLAQPILEKSISNSMEISNLLKEKEGELLADHRPVPISIRDNTSLFFYHNALGERFRLKCNEDFTFNGQEESKNKISADDLLLKLKCTPNSFSTSALLRPIVQDYLFDTLAYIGGEVELDYHYQIDSLYQYFNIPVPLRIKRCRGLVLPDKNYTFFKDTTLDTRNLFATKNTFELLIKEKTTETTNKDNVKYKQLEEYKSALFKTINSLAEEENEKKLDKLDLTKARTKTTSSIERSLSKFIRKYELSRMRTDNVLVGRFKKLLNIIWPNNNKLNQERILSWCSLYDYDPKILDQINNKIKIEINNSVKVNIN